MHRRRVDPDHSRHARTRIAITMTKNRAEEERILCTSEVGATADCQLELALEHQPELFALMLDRVLTAPVRLDDADIRLQQHAVAERNHPLILAAFAAAERTD